MIIESSTFAWLILTSKSLSTSSLVSSSSSEVVVDVVVVVSKPIYDDYINQSFQSLLGDEYRTTDANLLNTNLVVVGKNLLVLSSFYSS